MSTAPLRVLSEFSTPTADDGLRPAFDVPPTGREYGKQYANLYWLRLADLRNRVAKRAKTLWEDMPGATHKPRHVKRVLDVEQGKLCYIVGTVYMDMPLKPNVLEDLAREHYIAAPPPLAKFHSASDEIMLEDESGRVRLVGDRVSGGSGTFVTGTIMAALGAETSTGDFEVLEICYAGLPHQPELPDIADSGMEVDGEGAKEDAGEWVALVSGLSFTGKNDVNDLKADVLAEWLLGELGDEEDAKDATKVSRLIIAGNSLATPTVDPEDAAKPKRYGYDSTLFSSAPTTSFDNFLSTLLPSMSVDIMPGETDPTGPTMPQQAIHKAMFAEAGQFERFAMRSNPWWCDVGGSGFLGTSGQTLDDIFKYLSSDSRLEMAAQTLEWAHIAPTCPDTLWCYPFSNHDPFILHQTPRVYFIGNQPRFETTTLEGDDGQKVRIVLLPKFRETGEVVLVNSRSGEVKVRSFGAE
ncbi:hypothetical protein MNV49_005169 [Pseudohyphozyma bogoriensis]|nr:hypothetical protein MNV49_005169 [Pseudohyphozyma bogoriensis]